MPSDKATREDYLGFKPYVEAIAKLISQFTFDDLPLTLGIYGPWGAGKTSFMLQVKDVLDFEKHGNTPVVTTIWFDAWKYDRMEDVRSALLNQIIVDIEKRTSSQALKKKIEEKGKFISRVLSGLFLRSHLTIGIAGTSLKLPSAEDVEKYADETCKFQTEIDNIAEAFSDVVNLYLGDDKDNERKLVIFIDDLDRCLLENVIVVLEALKLFLIESRCIFVIGVDRTVVEKAVQAHYGNVPYFSREYLDKIIQYSFTVPSPNPFTLREFFAQKATSLDLNEKCLFVLESAAQGNPRIYLRLMNAWKVVSALAPEITPDLWNNSMRHILAVAVAIHVRFPSFYEPCKNNPEGLQTFFKALSDTGMRMEATTYLEKNDAPEFVEFWQNPLLKQFIIGLKGELGPGAKDIFGLPDETLAAFNLSGNVI